MSTKVFNLVACIVGAAGAVAAGLVTFFNPPMAGAINASIEIGTTAVVTICANFVKKDL